MCIYHRPHFLQLASLLAAERASPIMQSAEQLDYVTRAIADILQADNPAFRRNAFLRNAGAEHLQLKQAEASPDPAMLQAPASDTAAEAGEAHYS